MKVYINKYRHHWLSPYTILEKVFFWREIEYEEVLIDRLATLLEPACQGLQKVLDIIHPKVDYVKIDKWDTWSMDATLAKIILPMLKQLKDTKHGAPNVDDEDVPEELRSTVPAAEQAKENEWDVDGNHFKRWDYVLNEIIWAFEQKNDDNWTDQYYSGVADYIHVECDEVHPTYGKLFTMKPGPNHTQVVDWDGMKAHQERMTNGFKLFGKYYEGLWD
jgi:hypothetical protein